MSSSVSLTIIIGMIGTVPSLASMLVFALLGKERSLVISLVGLIVSLLVLMAGVVGLTVDSLINNLNR